MNHQASKISFIGGGNMAQAIIRGLIDAGHPAGNLHATDPDKKQRATLQKLSESMRVHSHNSEAIGSADVIVLAVKPQIMGQVAAELSGEINPDRQVLVSIAAGITLNSLIDWFGATAQVVRVMPNQPALVGEGMSGLCATNNVDSVGRELAGYVMQATGQIRWFDDEALIDSVTAISGSGPAYYYLVMEILQEVAEEFGFDAETARLLSVQTAIGASQVAGTSAESLAQLRERVTSPGGTTAAALAELEASGIRDIFRKALNAARDRSIELGQPGNTD